MEWRLLEGLPEEDVRRLLAGARVRKFTRNEVLFHEGDPADSLHLIRSGRVASRVTTPLGDTATFRVSGAGDVVGELALLSDQSQRSATVVALEPTETLVINQITFLALRESYPSVTDVLVQILAERVRSLSSSVVEALYIPADTRVLRRLVEVASLYREPEQPAVIPLTQQDLAGMAGTTRATVNRVLRKEENLGTLSLGRGKITVVDLESLARRAR